jgi:biotin synthase
VSLLETLVAKGLRRELPDRAELLALLAIDDAQTLPVVAAGYGIRSHYFGQRVKLNYLVNLKSGLCPEDCSYCSQRLGANTGVLKYSWLDPADAAAAAAAGVRSGAKRVCLVASGRGPSDRDIIRVADVISAVKEASPGVEVCACLGLLSDDQAGALLAAGVDAYHHNLNTSGERYADICTTHTYLDRVDTVRRIRQSGLSACSGIIAGMGESDEDLVDVTLALRGLDPESVPVNFLMPFDGTPMAGVWNLTPQRCLRILAMARFVFPDVEVLYLANSIFLGDYLTSEGQQGHHDLDMIRDAGFVVEGAAETTLPDHRQEEVRLRRRGAGTNLSPNA